MTTEQLTKLRNRECLNLFSRIDKTFVKIQLNRKERSICWERYISLDRRNWIKQNAYLSLKDVKAVLQYYKNINTKLAA